MPSYVLDPEPFRDRVIDWMLRHERQYNAAHERGAEGANAARPAWSRLSPADYLAAHMGVSRSWVDKFLEGYTKEIHFDRADDLMCAMNIAHEWITNPVFREIYFSVDLAKLDKVKPCTKRRHLGGKQRKVNYQAIKLLYQSGMSREEIKEQLGCSSGQIDRCVRLLGLSGRAHAGKNGVPRSFDYAEAARLHEEEGLTWREIAEMLGVDVRTVYQGMRRVRQGATELTVAA